jgi:hypothetical protein
VTSLVFVSCLQFLFADVAKSSALCFILFSRASDDLARPGTIVGLDFVILECISSIFYLNECIAPDFFFLKKERTRGGRRANGHMVAFTSLFV